MSFPEILAAVLELPRADKLRLIKALTGDLASVVPGVPGATDDIARTPEAETPSE